MAQNQWKQKSGMNGPSKGDESKIGTEDSTRRGGNRIQRADDNRIGLKYNRRAPWLVAPTHVYKLMYLIVRFRYADAAAEGNADGRSKMFQHIWPSQDFEGKLAQLAHSGDTPCISPSLGNRQLIS